MTLLSVYALSSYYTLHTTQDDYNEDVLGAALWLNGNSSFYKGSPCIAV